MTHPDSEASHATSGLTQRSNRSWLASPTLDLRTPSPSFQTDHRSIAPIFDALAKQPLSLSLLWTGVLLTIYVASDNTACSWA